MIGDAEFMERLGEGMLADLRALYAKRTPVDPNPCFIENFQTKERIEGCFADLAHFDKRIWGPVRRRIPFDSGNWKRMPNGVTVKIA